MRSLFTPRFRAISTGIGAVAVLMIGTISLAEPRIPTTLNDFYLYGTQPYPGSPDNPNFDPITQPDNCLACHTDTLREQPGAYTVPGERWSYTMMAQAWRDPVVQAAIQIAEKDASFAADTCMRCHAYAGWVSGRGNVPGATTPTKGENFSQEDRHGVQCAVCHRVVDPEYKPGISPSVDVLVFQALGLDAPPNFAPNGLIPGGPQNGQGLVLDPRNRRRGPFDPISCFHGDTFESPFHLQSGMCASCHDVSNPVYSRQPDGSYAPNALGAKHPTGNKYEMYPMDRLFSEWLASDFATTGVTLTMPNPNGGPGTVGRFSLDGVTLDANSPGNDIKIFNNRTSYDTCQSCHMPETSGPGCDSIFGTPHHPNAPVHNFNGVNSWVLRAVNDLYTVDEHFLFESAFIDESIARNVSMLKRSADLTLSSAGANLNVRITNHAGHKLPSGYSEGRRMWINVQFLDANDAVIAERGHYDLATATLTEGNTKVYEALHGLDAPMAAAAGLPAGPSFHIDINNKVYKDNRIPPHGFTNAKFTAIQSPPIAYSYADGQYWDDTQFAVPVGATKARVNIYHQTSSREYMEFLRDGANDPIPPGNFLQPPAGSTATTLGEIVYEQWVKWGKSAPVLMVSGEITLGSGKCQPADIAADDGTPLPTDTSVHPNGGVNEGDYNSFFQGFFNAAANCDIANDDGTPLPPFGTLTTNGGVNEGDYNCFFMRFFDGCP